MFVWRRASRLPTVIVMRRQHPEQRLRTRPWPREADEQQRQQRDEAGRLRGHRQERGDRRRRALVGVGRPGVERHRRDLEREADDDEHDGERDHRLVAGLASTAAAMPVEQRRAGHAVEQRHAVEHHAPTRTRRAGSTSRRPRCSSVALAPRGQHVGRDRQQLEGDEDADQVARRAIITMPSTELSSRK